MIFLLVGLALLFVLAFLVGISMVTLERQRKRELLWREARSGRHGRL